MSDEIMLVFGEDGVAREYDDTWDITIHCESEEEQKAVLEKLNNSNQEAQELSKNSPKLDKENGDLQPTCNQLEKDICVPCKDSISRQAAIDAVKHAWAKGLEPSQYIEELPSAPEPSIPVSWIEKHVDWLKNMDNGFATLTAMNISTMVKKWKKEQEEADGSDKPTSGD